MRTIIRRFSIILVLVISLVGCRGQQLSREDPVPSKIENKINDLEEITTPMSEYVPEMVVANAILKHNAQDNGTVGKVCDAIDLVEPNIQEQLTLRTSATGHNDTSTVEVIQEMLNQFGEMRQILGCESLAQVEP